MQAALGGRSVLGLPSRDARPCYIFPGRSVAFESRQQTSRSSSRRRQVVRSQVVEVAQETARFPRWDKIFDQLNENSVKSVKATEARGLMDKGYVLVDVRPPHIYEKAHPEGARNVPLFQKVNFRNFSVSGYLRAAALALNGVTPVEPNPDFRSQLLEAAGEGGKIIMACEAGGSLIPNASFSHGKESRSLKETRTPAFVAKLDAVQAAWKAVVSKKYSDIKHLSGGVYGWYKADLPFQGQYDLENVGRTPNVVSGED